MVLSVTILEPIVLVASRTILLAIHQERVSGGHVERFNWKMETVRVVNRSGELYIKFTDCVFESVS